MIEFGEAEEFSDGDFKTAFREFDKDRNGRISKDEMRLFIIKMSDL